jgi:hypothetical protein
MLSEDLVEQVASRVQHGVPLQTALKAAGVTDAMVREWERIAKGVASDNEGTREWITAFSERIGRAQAECEATLVEGIVETSATIGKSGLPEWRAGAWLLNNAPQYRDTYRQQREMRITREVPEHHEQQLVEQNEHDTALLEQWAELELPEPDTAA